MLVAIIIFTSLMLIMSDSLLDRVSILISLEVFVYLVSVAKVWFHVIMMLILLEFFSIKGFVVLALKRVTLINPRALFLFAVLMVCEARLGMGLVVRVSRGRGDERVVI